MFAAVILICAVISGALSKDEQVVVVVPASAVFGPTCFMSCIQKDDYFPGTMDFLEKINTYKYENYQDICGKQILMRACIKNCNQSVNPFESRSEKTMCDSARLEELKTHEQCFVAHGAAIKKKCDTDCGGSMTETNKTRTQFDFTSAIADTVQNVQCRQQKCHLRCFVDTISSECKATDPEASSFMKEWLEDILSAIRYELTTATAADADVDRMPGDCEGLLEPHSVFVEKAVDNPDFAFKSSDVIRAPLISLFVIVFAFVAQSYFY